MPRCPDYLNPNDFDKLADSLGLILTDEGVSAVGEIVEKLAVQILKQASLAKKPNSSLSMADIISTAKKLGIKVEVYTNPKDKLIYSAEI